MNKRFDIFTFILVLLILSIIFFLLPFSITAMISSSADAEAREIMEQAQERIDLYKAASTPAKERPTATVVVYEESPAVETPEPPPEPAEDWYIESIPLDKQLQKVVFDAACENGVDYFTALGLIRVESNFQLDAVSPCGSYGLCQLNRAGMKYLGQLMETHQGNIEAALRAFNRGYDDGARGYPYAVLSSAEDIMRQAGVVFP